ncbi:hypothetical protein F8S13_03945 [Chloroflexia bacterium SDU3-3]|nr:hypothetical protein F8S13_03945 [Chloroflexia bacterium SDU3-3]
MEREQVLAMPREEVRRYAPKTVVWAPGGTRRHAALAGVSVDGRYFDWAWDQQFGKVELFFDLGVQRFFSPVLGPPQVREVGIYQDQLRAALARLCDEQSLAFYQKLGVRVRFYGAHNLPFASDLFSATEQRTAENGPRELWWTMVISRAEEAIWDATQAAIQAGARSFEQAVRAYYGQDLDPVDVFIGFGKPQAGYLMPPFLGERADLYWTTFPSYQIDESDIRTIFWDHRFGRTTWQADKTNRYADIAQSGLRERYEQHTIVGVGERIGTFWHQRGL